MPQEQTLIEDDKIKIFYNQEMEDLPFPEKQGYSFLVEKPTSLEDINKAEGTKLGNALDKTVDTSDDLSQGATNKYLLDLAVTELKLATGAVTNAKIAVNAIQGDVIAAGAITETKIGTNAISSGKIAAGAIIAGKIAAGVITATEIAAGAITSTKIYAGAVTSDKITVSQLSAISANIGEVTAGKITGLTIRTAASGQRIALEGAGGELGFPHEILVYPASGNPLEIFGGADAFYVKANLAVKPISFENLSGYGAFQINEISVRSRDVLPYSTGEDLGGSASANRWANVYAIAGNFSGNVTVGGYVYSTNILRSDTSVLAPAFSAYGGGKANFTGNFTACPLPISISSALEKIGNPKPTPYEKLKDKRFAERDIDRKDMGIERMYYDIKQVPKECRFINSKGKDDIEISRTVGFLYQCVVELNNKMKSFEQKVDSIK